MLVRRFPYRTQLGIERQLHDMQRLLDHLFGDEMRSEASDDDQGRDQDEPASFRHPSTDIHRREGKLVVEMDLPGVDIEEDVEVRVEDGMLTVQGQRSSSRSRRAGEAYLTERRTGRFSRSISLPDGVNPDDIEADYTDGVLTIDIPIPESSEPSARRVQIGTGSGSDRGADRSRAIEVEEASDRQSDSDDEQGSKAPSGRSTAEKTSKRSSAKTSSSKDESKGSSKRSSKDTGSKRSSSKQSSSKRSGSKRSSSKSS